MDDKIQIKAVLATVWSLAINVRDQLAESYDQITYTNLCDNFKQQINELENAYAAGSDDLAQVEQDEVLASLSSARCWQIKLLECTNFISSMSNVQSTVVKKKFGRLPEAKLVTFKGNFDEWETFWSSFRTSVDVQDDLEKATKFIYLVQSLEGEPKEMIIGLSITDDNYTVAIQILKDRYADASRQTHVLLQKFHSLPPPQHNPKDLRNFLTEYRKVKTQLRHAVDFDQAELVIKSTLVRKLTFQTFDKICDLYVTHDFTLKQMETGIQHIIDKLEQATLVGVSYNKQTNKRIVNRISRIEIQIKSVHIVAVVTLPTSEQSTKLSMQEKIELWL